MGAGSWLVWARGQTSVKAADRALLSELALLVDEAGLCSASVGYLARVTGLHRSTIFRSLERLEDADLLRREARFGADGERLESLFQLGEHVVQPGEPEVSEGCACRAELAQVEGLDDSSSEKLRRLLVLCVSSNWCECSDEALSQLLARQGGRQFSTTARRRVRLNADERIPDTVSIAWQVCKEQSQVVIDARSAWGLLTNLVRKRCVEVDVSRYIDEEKMLSPELMPMAEGQGQHVLGDGVKPRHVDFEGVLPVLGEVENELVAAGFNRTLVRAVNRRLLDIALNTRKNHEHTEAAKDDVLSMLVPTAQARRDWMTLLIGSRRNGRSLLVSTVEERASVIGAIQRNWVADKIA
ncbi:MAG: helix-turn-helix domain-containing protein [Actinomycetaceae bacterium]|nr:helix-turn-helix domain-containing protein [Actinomycetaceae bacterium]